MGLDFDIKEIFNYGWFIFMGIWGSTVSYLEKTSSGELKHTVSRLFIEWTTSAFVAIVTAYGCKFFEFGFAATAGLTGIAGHMGDAPFS